MLIGDKLIGSAKTRKVINPFTNEAVGEVSEADSGHFQQSAAYLNEIFTHYGKSPVYLRSQLLYLISAKLSEHRENLAILITKETGKPIKFSRIEMDRAILTFMLGAEECSRIHGEVLDLSLLPGSENKTGIVRRFPIGMILGITPWNFPMNLVAHKLAPALASGNVIMIKPSQTQCLQDSKSEN